MVDVLGSASAGVTLAAGASGSVEFVCTATLMVRMRTMDRGVRWPSYVQEDGSAAVAELSESDDNTRDVQQAGQSLTMTRVFQVLGTRDPTQCLDLGPQVGDADDVLPDFIVTGRNLSTYAKGGPSSNMVRITVKYAKPEDPQNSGGDSESTLTYEFTSESEHVDLALSQDHYGKDPLPGEENLVNFDGASVEGIDIDGPVSEFTEEHDFTTSEFNPTYRKMLHGLVQTVNSEPFRGYEPGEVLFVGASASKSNSRWSVSFRFRVRKNVVGRVFTIFDDAGGVNDDGDIDDNAGRQNVTVDKLGWDYLWISYQKKPAKNKTVIRVTPRAVHVAKLREEIDFAVLNIGVLPQD